FIDDALMDMGKGSASSVGTGGMSAKLEAARIAADSGADMIITNGEDITNIEKIMAGEKIGTLFLAHKDPKFDLMESL
ncbi:MAG: hypothetical protein PUF12_09075, partial [Thermoflexaceae bacterium]|nr:hypothetical protein [Thermoflexaceae bacterium]